MERKSKNVTAIKVAVTNGKLKQPFTVTDVNSACNNLLEKSSSFFSRHRKDNPDGYKVYFK